VRISDVREPAPLSSVMLYMLCDVQLIMYEP
jgi:hypothetical protein